MACRPRSHRLSLFFNMLYNAPVLKVTYLVFITSEGQFFEWNVESIGDTVKYTKNEQKLLTYLPYFKQICTKNLKKLVKFRKVQTSLTVSLQAFASYNFTRSFKQAFQLFPIVKSDFIALFQQPFFTERKSRFKMHNSLINTTTHTYREHTCMSV